MRSEKGFTLTELLVVIAIMAVLAMVTIPTVGPMFRDHALDSSMSSVQGVILKARSLAAVNRCVYYVSFNTLPANSKRTQDFMVIYSGKYWNDDVNKLLDIDPEKWHDYWDNGIEYDDGGTLKRLGKKESKKIMTAASPVYLEKNCCLGLTSGAYGEYSNTNDRRSFLEFRASGEIVFGGNFDSSSSSAEGRNLAITKDSSDYSDYLDDLGTVLFFVKDMSEDDSRSDTDIDKNIDRRIGLVLLTGDFHKID